MNLFKSAGRALGLLGLAIAVTRWSRARSATTATVIWTVRVPTNTPPDATIYLCGNHPAFGSWAPAGIAMRRVRANVYSVQTKLPLHTSLEYKFTRGSWQTVESEPERSERANRRLDIVHSEQVLANVDAWTDLT